MLDSKWSPWVLEINAGPSLAVTQTMDTIVKNHVLTDMLHLVGLAPAPFDRESFIAAMNQEESTSTHKVVMIQSVTKWMKHSILDNVYPKNIKHLKGFNQVEDLRNSSSRDDTIMPTFPSKCERKAAWTEVPCSRCAEPIEATELLRTQQELENIGGFMRFYPPTSSPAFWQEQLFEEPSTEESNVGSWETVYSARADPREEFGYLGIPNPKRILTKFNSWSNLRLPKVVESAIDLLVLQWEELSRECLSEDSLSIFNCNLKSAIYDRISRLFCR